jgi:hypothetical protein
MFDDVNRKLNAPGSPHPPAPPAAIKHFYLPKPSRTFGKAPSAKGGKGHGHGKTYGRGGKRKRGHWP